MERYSKEKRSSRRKNSGSSIDKMKNKEEILTAIRSKKLYISTAFGVDNIALFGSYSRGEQAISSDADIIISLKEGFKTFDNFMSLKFFLEDLLGLKIDLVIKESIRKEFRNRILNEAEYA